MTQQVQVFHNLTQVFNQISTLTLLQGLLLTFLAGPQQMVRRLWTGFQTALCLLIMLIAIFALLKCFAFWVTKTLPVAFNISLVQTVYDFP